MMTITNFVILNSLHTTTSMTMSYIFNYIFIFSFVSILYTASIQFEPCLRLSFLLKTLRISQWLYQIKIQQQRKAKAL